MHTCRKCEQVPLVKDIMMEELDFTETNVRVSQGNKGDTRDHSLFTTPKTDGGETAGTVFCSQFGGPRVWIEFRGYLLLLEDAGLS